MTTMLATTAPVLETAGHPDDKWGWAVQVALSIKNIPTGAGDMINMQAVYTDGATRYNFQSLAAAANYAMYGGTGLAGAYQSVGFAIAAGRRVRHRVASQQLIHDLGLPWCVTPTTGIRTGTPAIYGAYAAVSITATSRHDLRHLRPAGSFGALLTAG